MASSSRTLLLLFISSFLFGHSSPLTEYQIKGIDIANPELHFTPSNKNGDIYCERVRVSGVSMANIRSFANSYRVAVTPSVAIPERLHTKIEVCFHRNATRGYCKCGKDEWKGIHKGQWMSVMSPFEDRFVDVKVLGGTGAMTVSVKEDFHEWRVYCLVVGFLLLLIALVISGWVPFYYSSSMVVGILLVVLVLLFQVGLGSYLVHYFSMLINSILVSFGLSEDMYNPQRSATKVTFPLVWTNTCCSHPLYRDSELIEENYLGVRNAAQRKLFDELGVPAENLPVDEFIPLGRILYKAPSDGKWREHELDYLLFIVRDVKFNPNPNEVADAKYVNREQLKEILGKADAGEDGVKLSPWFKLVVENFLFKWWDHVEQQTIKEVADMKTIHKLT